jgi:hypothetical protein
MIRALRPTDLGPFLTFRARGPENEALLGPVNRPNGLAFGEFVDRSFAIKPGRETWVQIEHRQIFGLVGARARFGTDVWDIDRLVIAPSVDDDRVCLRLLDHLCEAAVEEGVQKVFLRLGAESPWIGPARQAGFVHYTTEQIFVQPQVGQIRRPTVAGLRPRRPADHQALFQLYSAAVPAYVRQIEALTLQEWRWTDNWGIVAMAPFRANLSRRRRDLVVQGEDRLEAWLQVDLHARSLQLTTDPRGPIDVPLLLTRGLAELQAGRPAVFALRDYQTELAAHLEDLGFLAGESQALLARVLSVRVPERRLVPARVV